MPGKRSTPEQREMAVALAAGASATGPAQSLGVHPTTVQRWRNQASRTGTVQAFAARKRAEVQNVVLERLRARSERIMDGIGEIPMVTMKDVQAAATALGIMDDHFGGRQSSSSGRFGGEDPFDGEVIETAERITRRYHTRTRG